MKNLEELEEKLGKFIPLEELEDALKGKIKKEVLDDSIQKLITSGDVFIPREGFIQRI